MAGWTLAGLGLQGSLVASTAVALLAGRDALAAKGGASTESDVRILNTALGAELEAVAAYQVGAESGLLAKPALDLAVSFQGHHREHADILAKTIRQLGGRAVSVWKTVRIRFAATPAAGAGIGVEGEDRPL